MRIMARLVCTGGAMVICRAPELLPPLTYGTRKIAPSSYVMHSERPRKLTIRVACGVGAALFSHPKLAKICYHKLENPVTAETEFC